MWPASLITGPAWNLGTSASVDFRALCRGRSGRAAGAGAAPGSRSGVRGAIARRGRRSHLLAAQHGSQGQSEDRSPSVAPRPLVGAKGRANGVVRQPLLHGSPRSPGSAPVRTVRRGRAGAHRDQSTTRPGGSIPETAGYAARRVRCADHRFANGRVTINLKDQAPPQLAGGVDRGRARSRRRQPAQPRG